MVRRETIQRVATPTAILVGIAEPLATACSDALAEGGLRVLRVGHAAGASERIPVVMPQLVVVSSLLGTGDTEMLTDRCVAVGAEIFSLPPDADVNAEGGKLRGRLRDASNMALIRSMRQGS